MNQSTLFFVVQFLRRKSGVYIFKAPQGDDEWKYKWRKDIEGENSENNISIYEIHFPKYQLIKRMYKMIKGCINHLKPIAIQGYRQTKRFLKKCLTMINFVKTGA